MTTAADIAELVGKVHLGDCRDLAAALVAAGVTVDAMITSPPYPQGKKKVEDLGRYRRTGTAEEQREVMGGSNPAWATRSAEHPSGILSQRDRAGHIHGQPNAKGETGLEVRIAAPDWLDWFLEITDALKPALKPNGNFIVNVDSCCYPTRHRHWGVFSLPERMEERGWCFAEALIWTKPNGPPVSATTRFHHSWELVYHFSNGDRWQTDLDSLRYPHSAKSQAREDGNGNGQTKSRGLRWSHRDAGQKIPVVLNPAGARPKDVFPCAVGGMRWDTVGGAHFAAMPLALAEWIVKWATKPGDLVFDPFGGAGTTPVACIRQGRRWIMSEITEAAALIAERRIQLATQGYMDEQIQPEREQVTLPLGEAP